MLKKSFEMSILRYRKKKVTFCDGGGHKQSGLISQRLPFITKYSNLKECEHVSD
jgi:hypothetical protein